MGYDATVVIVTRNRREELRHALRSASEQEGAIELLVIDDGSSDGTAEMVRADFPDARLVRYEESAGLVVRRNDAARIASGAVLVSIDDDAVFSSPHVVAQTLSDFDHPRVGAVAIPYIDVTLGPQEHHRAPEPVGRWVIPTFRGTAYAIRREAFCALGGFRELIFHQGEERDLALRMLAAGLLVRAGRSDPVHHHASPSRDLVRMARYGRRNELLLTFTYFPLRTAMPMMLGYAVNGVLLGVRLDNTREMLRGIRMGLRSCWDHRRERSPLPGPVVALDRRMRRSRLLPLAEVERRLVSQSG